MRHDTQRQFVRKTLRDEVNRRALGPRFVEATQVPPGSASLAYRDQLNLQGSPSQKVAAGYRWMPGTELIERAAQLGATEGRVQ